MSGGGRASGGAGVATRPGAPRARPPRGPARPGGAAAPPGRSRARDVASGVVLGLLVGILGTVAVIELPGEDRVSAAPGDAAAPSAPGPGVGPADPLAGRVAELSALDAERDAVELGRLTDQTAQALALVGPVFTEAGAQAGSGQVPDPGQLTAWSAAAVAARGAFGDPPSAGTEVNIARSGLVAALGNVDVMVSAFQLAAGAADPAPALALAEAARQDGAFTWSVGATQLDAVNVAAGNGHVHLFLPPVPGSGALTPDPAATGAS